MTAGALPLAITRGDVANYVTVLATIYFVLIFLRILLTWITLPYSRPLRIVTDFITDVTDPYLNLFRRFLPLVRLGPAALDLSPIVAIFVLWIVAGLAQAAIRG